MVTVKDVARKANVSMATVSLVLNGKPFVKDTTRAHVLACVEELGYRPNMVARSVRTSTTKAISVLIPTITNPVYPSIVQGIERAARTEGYQVILCSYAGEYLPPSEIDLLSDLFDRMVDGLIVCGIPPMPDERHDRRVRATVQHFISRGTPFVFLSEEEQLSCFAQKLHVDLDAHRDLFHLLTIDREKAAHGAVSHLLQLGHRRIAMAAEDTRDRYPHNITYLRKLSGYRRALEEYGIGFDADLVVGAPSDYMGGGQCLERLLQGASVPTAVFCTGDTLALGILRGARKRGLAIPADLAVIGFDNIPLAGFWNPTLSTVAVPIPRMAEEAFHRLNRLMKGERILPTRMVFDTELVIRESCP